MASDLTARLGGARSSLAFKAPCKVATTANIALTGTQTIDGVAVVAGDRVLVKDQTTGSENGIYECKATAWTRAKDFDGTGDIVSGTRVFITSGSANAALEFYVTTADPITIGTTSITFVSSLEYSAITPTTTRGDLIRRGASADERVALGTSGYALISDGTDPVWTGFLQSGTGAVTRTWNAKAADVLHADDFGFSTAASAADRVTAVNNALTRAAAIGRKAVILPGGQFDVDGIITSSASNIALIGDGKAQTFLVQQTASAPTLSFSGSYVGIHGLGIAYASTPTSGADAIQLSGDYPYVSDVWVLSSDRAIVISGDGPSLDQIKITSCNVNGILATDVIGGRWSNIQIEAGGTSMASLGCIRLVNGTEAIEATNIECLEGVYSITTDAVTPGFGTQPAYLHFTNCIFDAAGQGNSLTDVATSMFTNCWWSGGRTGGGYYGVVLDNCTDVSFVNNTVVNCGSGGMYIAATSSNIRFLGGIVGSNSVTSGSGVNSGIEIAANTNDVTILYPTGGNGQVPGGQQGYDVSVAAGTSGRVVVRLSSGGGVTGIATHGGTGTGNIMELNGTVYQGGSWIPFANDGGAIGASGQAVSDVFVASGGVLNFAAGNVALTHSSGQLVATAGAVGYGPGNGGSVEQITSRTTGVTLNKLSGQILLVSAAGSATPASFTVTNSTVTSTDEISVWQVAGADLYITLVTAVGSGSFQITFYTTGGTTTEQPIFGFAVRRGATS